MQTSTRESTEQSTDTKPSSGREKRRIQKRHEVQKKSGSSQSGRVAFSGETDSKTVKKEPKSATYPSDTSSDYHKSTRRSSEKSNQTKKQVSFTFDDEQEAAKLESEEDIQEEDVEMDEDESDTEAGAWPPRFNDPDGPNTLPMETVEGDLFLENRKSGSREEERKLSLAEKETAEALLSHELADRAGLIGLGLSSDAHAVENAAAALCGSDFANINDVCIQ